MVRFTLIYLDIMHVVKKGLWLHFAIKSKEEPMKSDANWFRWTRVNRLLGSAKAKNLQYPIISAYVVASQRRWAWFYRLNEEWVYRSNDECAVKHVACIAFVKAFSTVWTAPILDIRNTSLVQKYPWSEVTKDYGLFLLLLYCWNKPKVG